MKDNLLLTSASLLSILFATFHLADDIARGMSPGGLSNLVAVVICVTWLYERSFSPHGQQAISPSLSARSC